MEPIITVNKLGKCYTISHQGTKKYDTLRDEMSGWLRNFTKKKSIEERSSKEIFWALKDVSFEVNPGDRLGIIGRNGAGKSTLLKILSRITEPTTGEIRIKGRVASLLEVGTGFHPELTGRENIYLNGAILGMSRAEIKRKFDEIVAFSEVEKFLDTPVKRYSSGMYVRLAFAVAAHLEPEILIVDEVLAVGDAQFQKKCLGKMEDVSTKEGRTVLFVSHQMNAINSFCTSGIILEKGEIKLYSNRVKDIIAEYMRPLSNMPTMTVWENNGQFKSPYFIPEKMYLLNEERKITNEIFIKNTANLVVEAEIKEQNFLLNVGVIVYRMTGEVCFSTWLKDCCKDNIATNGYNMFYIKLPTDIMNIGEYRITLVAGLHHLSNIITGNSNPPSLSFSIIGSIPTDYGDDTREGVLLPLIEWKKTV